MSLKNRQQQQANQGQQMYPGGAGAATITGDSRAAMPAQLVGGREYFSIVDGEIVNVVGTTDIPGMSLAWLCQSEEDGSTAPVSHKEAPLFTTAQRALQFLNEQRGEAQPSNLRRERNR